MTWRMRPTILVAITLSSSLSSAASSAKRRAPNSFQLRLKRLGTRDDLDQLFRDHRLPSAVVPQCQAVDHLAGVAAGAVHGRHARALLRCGVLEQSAEDLGGDVAGEEALEDLFFARLVFVDGLRA